MKNHQIEAGPSSDPITKKAVELAGALAERSSMNKDLLIALAHALAANEKTQRKFRNAVFVRLTRIETIVQMIHGAQIVEAHHSEPGFEDKSRKHAENAEQFISQHGQELGLKMVKYVYGGSEEPSAPRGGRRKWSDWEI